MSRLQPDGTEKRPRTQTSRAARDSKPPEKGAEERHELNLSLTLTDLELIEKGRIIPLNELRLFETRTRNKKTINDYLLRRKTSTPPNLTVVEPEGEDGEPGVVVDGVTRYYAAAIDGATEIACDVYKGTWEQIRILAFKLNQHGEKIPVEDIKRQIDQMDQEYGDNLLSSREMSKIFGLSHTAIAAHRIKREQSTLEGIKGMRPGKGPDEKRADMVKSVNRMIGEQGDEILYDIVASLPVNLRKQFLTKLAEVYAG